MIDEALTEAGVALPGLAGIVAVRGPGSFTGLRVGLATAYGLHQATGLPVTAVSTWQALAAAAPAPPGRPVAAAVDILRGLWAVQTFTAGDPPRAQGDPRRLAAADLSTLGPALLAGFGTTTLALPPDAGLEPWEPPALAAAVARSAARSLPCWNPALLTAPLYFQPPAVTPPGVRPPGARRS
jgi:tRNA threonylcarbamoyl adenosine modification protein YeaZ